jgi:hypothetical protein
MTRVPSVRIYASLQYDWLKNSPIGLDLHIQNIATYQDVRTRWEALVLPQRKKIAVRYSK